MLFGASYKCSTHQNCKRGLLGNCFNECYLLSKRQAVISFILKQKHTRKKEKEKKKKKDSEKEKRNKVITSPNNSVKGSIMHTR